MSDAKIKKRIRSLLNLAGDGGASTAEAHAALTMARGLMAKHGIEADALGVETPAKVAMNHKARRDYALSLSTSCAMLYGCKTLAFNDGKEGFAFVGRPDNIEAAEATFLWVSSQVGTMCAAATPPDVKGQARRAWVRSFKQAAVSRVHTRVLAILADVASVARESGSTALVVTGHMERLDAENDAAITAEMGAPVAKAEMSRPAIGAGTMAGFRAGDAVRIRREVEA